MLHEGRAPRERCTRTTAGAYVERGAESRHVEHLEIIAGPAAGVVLSCCCILIYCRMWLSSYANITYTVNETPMGGPVGFID
jgi:hypothetical protein